MTSLSHSAILANREIEVTPFPGAYFTGIKVLGEAIGWRVGLLPYNLLSLGLEVGEKGERSRV